MRIAKAILLGTTCLVVPEAASAAPVAGFIFSIGSGIAGTSVALGTIAGFSGVGLAIGNFLGGTLLGNILLNLGVNALIGALSGGPSSQDIEASLVNSRIEDPQRYQLMGDVAVGGAAGIFGEFDGDGNFWYIVAHGDAELTNDPSYILDGINVTLSDGADGFTAGDVLTDDFCLDNDKNRYEGTGTRNTYFRVYTQTPDASNVYAALPSDFTTAFPDLPSDFRLAGVCYTIIRIRSISLNHFSKVFRWRGAIGIGEPTVKIAGNFNRMYDPRNVAHAIDDPDTWTASTGNSAIVWAWWRTHVFGRGRPMSEVNWDKVADAADVCDSTVTDRSGVETPLYRCGLAISDRTERSKAERQILATCDGFVAYDNVGAAYPVVGEYVIPTYTFTADRDIVAATTQIVDDGETPMDGVVVRYISPDHGYTKQPCAPWVNTDHYVAGSSPSYQFIDILGCQNHNQAVRLAKAFGQKSAPTKRASLGTKLKGQLVGSERAINLSYDAQFTGVFEVATPVKEQEDGMVCAFAVVPLAEDRWYLNAGEEGAPPSPTPALNIDDSLADAENVVIISQQVATDNGSAVRFYATFDAPSRVDRLYKFRYALTGTTVYEYFAVNMDENIAYSAILEDGQVYDVSYQTETAGGRAGGWSTAAQITATANPTAPASLASANAVGGTGEIAYTYTTANDPNQYSVSLYRGATSVFAEATQVNSAIVAGANTSGSYDEISVAAGPYYCWVQPANGSGVTGTESGPFAVTVT